MSSVLLVEDTSPYEEDDESDFFESRAGRVSDVIRRSGVSRSFLSVGKERVAEATLLGNVPKSLPYGRLVRISVDDEEAKFRRLAPEVRGGAAAGPERAAIDCTDCPFLETGLKRGPAVDELADILDLSDSGEFSMEKNSALEEDRESL